MAEKDVVSIDYFGNKERFADLLVFLFNYSAENIPRGVFSHFG